ncbi:UDP-3-O-(3-hydroxymyristoyl)glucosamine N-acyltransferase [Desulforhopalus singaporensis]|uniref:UDP-3-O-acylglucosamine N-acyltransferase n=1 Tax=Desulforhopalus singaporensis TaxID=91360 RepID=A0A1H0P2P2_9BACT|nr:UDP-3-O-(3-hydroxymyristoyl)glucosamine N-acyltransferase [Desulforhopalus singaporensis]SDO98998.1 UDP-3-O-[3-hydroxymyristoyl] glucosamine N-acyltransferase [Desulforhopalus singaporensis]
MDQKEITVEALADLVGGRVVGNGAKKITGFAPIETAGLDDVTFLADKKRLSLLADKEFDTVIVPHDVEEAFGKILIQVRNPYLAVALIHNYFLEKPFVAKGVHPRAFVGEGSRLGKEVTVAPMAVIGDNVTIGERVLIESGAVIGDNVSIGDDTVIHANVTVYKECVIGNRVSIHSGTVVGSDGYGYATDEKGEHVKRPQTGIVRIGDDVEIGANACIDRAAYGETHIKAGGKIDNLVHVAHNVVVGENCLLVAQTGIAGSTTLGRNVVMGGQSASSGHIHIGDRVMIAGRGAVHNDQPDGALLGGTPAIDFKQWAKASAVFNKLPALQAAVRKNSKAIKQLQGSVDGEDNKGESGK